MSKLKELTPQLHIVTKDLKKVVSLFNTELDTTFF
ncbi:unknown [Bacteroides sp. CAG:443]|nr:unknown [Bacteroides sp. CAG:443]